MARVICDLCGARVAPHAHYVVKVEVYADPTLPPVNTDDWDEKTPAEDLAALLNELQEYSADELQDQVHRSFQYHLCPRCQPGFLANPLGRPRGNAPAGEN